MTQYGRPDETLVDYRFLGGQDWTASTGGQLWTVLDDETANDSQYVYCDFVGANYFGGIGLGLSDVSTPENLTNHVIKFRVKDSEPRGAIYGIYLFPDDETTFAGMLSSALVSYNEYYDDAPLTTSWAEHTWSLSTTQASAISSHYTKLAFGIQAGEGGGEPRISLSWVEFSCPDAATDSTTTGMDGPWISELTWESTATWTTPSELTSDNDPETPWSGETWEVPSAATDSDNTPWTPWPPDSEWSTIDPPIDPPWSSMTTDAVVTREPGFAGPGAFSPWFRMSSVTDDQYGVDFVLKVNDQFPDYVSDQQPLTIRESPVTEGI